MYAVPFHGLHFCKTKALGDLYKRMVKFAIQQSGSAEMISAYTKVEATINKNLGSDSYVHREDVYKSLWGFWKKYWKKLHPILQATDPIFQTALSDKNVSQETKADITAYLNALSDTSSYTQAE